MIELQTFSAAGVDPSTFGSSAGAMPPPAMPAPTDPDSLPWAKSVSALSQRLADLPLEFEQMTAVRANGLAGQAEMNAKALQMQHAVMTTTLTAQAAVQLMSSTSQVANRMLNQQGG